MVRALKTGIVVAWLITTSWLIRYEAYPEYFTAMRPGYRSVLSGDLLVLNQWWKISLHDHPAGYTHTWVEIQKDNPVEHYIVENHTELKLNVMGVSQRLRMTAQAFLDIGYQLRRFTLTVRTGNYRTHVLGERIRDSRFRIAFQSGGAEQVEYVDIPDDTIIYSPAFDLAVRNLQPGQSTSIRSFNPLTRRVSIARIRGLRRETIVQAGENIDATVLSMNAHGEEILAWVDDEGAILRQETSFGTVEASTAEECINLLLGDDEQPEILSAASVPAIGSVRRPRECRLMKVRLTGVDLRDYDLESIRQVVDVSSATQTVLAVHAAALPPAGVTTTSVIEPNSAALNPSPFLQSDHPAIRRQAKRITGDSHGAAAIARALAAWVDTHVEDKPSVGIPSALEVLQQLEGDCNEHTYLFVAMARALDIPSVIKAGVVYYDGAFYYHAWPAVFLGEWVEIDPTLHQFEADATHIALLEGEFENQIKLGRLLGRLRIEILESDSSSKERRGQGDPDA